MLFIYRIILTPKQYVHRADVLRKRAPGENLPTLLYELTLLRLMSRSLQPEPKRKAFHADG